MDEQNRPIRKFKGTDVNLNRVKWLTFEDYQGNEVSKYDPNNLKSGNCAEFTIGDDE